MPKEITHILIAQKVFKELENSGHTRLAGMIERHLPAFYLGSIIPDAFFYDVTPLRETLGGGIKIARALHSKKTSKNEEKALGFFDILSANPWWPWEIAFTAGIVTHVASDRIFHGVIDHFTTRWCRTRRLAVATHRQIETLIDMILLQESSTHPRRFQLKSWIDVPVSARNTLFQFYLKHLVGPGRSVPPGLFHALRRAHGQQLFFLRLFRIKILYQLTNLLNTLLANRLGIWLSLLYPQAATTKAFPVMERFDLNALTNGGSFQGGLTDMVQEVTKRTMALFQDGLRRLDSGH